MGRHWKQFKHDATAFNSFSKGSVSEKNLGSRKLLSQRFQIVLSEGPHPSEVPCVGEALKGGEGEWAGERFESHSHL